MKKTVKLGGTQSDFGVGDQKEEGGFDMKRPSNPIQGELQEKNDRKNGLEEEGYHSDISLELVQDEDGTLSKNAQFLCSQTCADSGRTVQMCRCAFPAAKGTILYSLAKSSSFFSPVLDTE